MTDYDRYLCLNPAEAEQDKHMRDFELWLDNEDDFNQVAGYLGWDDYDILNYVKDFQNDYELALEGLKEDYTEDLFDYYLEKEV